MKKRIALMVLALILTALVGLWTLLNSAAGSRWLVQTLLSVLPAQASVAKINGNLLGRISLEQVHYQTTNESIDIAHIDWDWRPLSLFRGQIHIVELRLDGIDLAIKASQPSTGEGFDPSTLTSVPLQLIVEKLSINDLRYREGDKQTMLQFLEASALSEGNRLKLTSFNLAAESFSAQAQGYLTLAQNLAFNLQSHWQIDSDTQGHWQADTLIEGDRERVQFTHAQATPFTFKLHGEVADLQSQPRIAAHGTWEKLRWPFIEQDAQLRSEQGRFEINGTLQDYALTLNTDLNQDSLPKAELQIKGSGSAKAFNIKELQLLSADAALRLTGWLNWQDAPAFELSASAENFDPAILWPALPGKLNLASRLQGQLKDGDNRINVTIDRLNGQLRNNPVAAQGRFDIANRTVAIHKLSIRSGPNQISADGHLSDADSELNFDIDTPALAAAWPGLSGRLKGSGQVQGHWQQPDITGKLQGAGLQFASKRLAKLTLDIDYKAAAANSRLHLEAAGLAIDAQTIDTLILDASGNLAQHRLNLDIRSPIVSLSSSVNGSWQKTQWQGTLHKFDLNHTETGTWRLRDPARLLLTQHEQALELAPTHFCLDQTAASLCLDGQYQANGDFALQLQAKSLPTQLMKAYLAKPWRLDGTLTAEAKLHRQKGVFSGDYQIEMPAQAKLSLDSSSPETGWSLGKCAINGRLQDKLLSADADLNLQGNDYLRAQLQMNLQANPTLSGRIGASIDEWALAQALLPSLSNPKGQLSADLNLSGTVVTPVVSGLLSFRHGALDLADAGIGFRDIELEVRASRDGGNRLQLNGAFSPRVLPDASKPARQIDARLPVTADLQQTSKGLQGTYRLDVPAGSNVTLTTSERPISLIFAASSLHGEINSDRVSAELDLSLNNQDYLRAHFDAALGNVDNLNGRVNASLQDLSFVDVLQPALSNVRGALAADLAIDGTLTKPNATGNIRLERAAMNVTDLGLAIRETELKLTSTADAPDRLQIIGNTRSGNGRLEIGGTTDLKGNADISLRGQDFEIAKLPEAQIEVSPDLRLLLTENGGKVSGQLAVPKAIIVMQELPKNAVAVSKDEVIVGEPQPVAKPLPESSLDADIDIALGQKVNFSGLGLSTDLDGALKMVKTGSQTRLHGSIAMKNGRYQSYGQDLTIRKGQFVFNGPVDAPWLDVEATRLSKNQEVTAILSLSGPLKAPKTRIYSEPALPEAEALAYLVTGSPLSQVGKSDGNMLASAALSYGAGQLSWLTEKLGVDQFEVKQGKTLEDTLVAMGQYLTEDFYVGTKLGIFNKQAVLVLKHKLTPSVNVETESGTSQRIKLNYEIDRD